MVKLVLIRHGQSIWNLENRFTGWVDVSLSKKGLKEAENAGKLLKNYKFDLAFTSRLLRAQETLNEVLNENKNITKYTRIHDGLGDDSKWYSNYTHTNSSDKELQIRISPSLNERYYGDLQGLNKDDTIKKYGEKQVHIWRRSFDIAPPNGESLEMTSKRSIPYFKKNILSELKKNKEIIISAHGNSLRSIIMFLEKLNKKEILDVEIPTGTPIVYELEFIDSKIKIISKKILK